MNRGKNNKLIANCKFGRLTPIRVVGKKNKKDNIWECKCDCGNTKNIVQSNFTRTNKPSRSCGCLGKEVSSKIHKNNTRRRLPKGISGFNDLVTTYKDAAKRRNLEFSINNEDLLKLFKQNCYYCGDEPKNRCRITAKTEEAKIHSEFIYNGLDRKDNNQGYTLQNVVPCCKICNLMKHTSSISDFIKKCTIIAKRFM